MGQAHLFLDPSHLREERSLLAWWGLMQHFGCPTRLLDWTASPYVATYFAVIEHDAEPGAVWVFDAETLVEETTRPEIVKVQKTLDSKDVWDVFWAPTAPEACELQFMPSVAGVSDIPKTGKSLAILAVVDHVFHFRVFDGDANMVVDIDEKSLTQSARQIQDLREQLADLWPPHELSEFEKVRIIAALTSIIGHTSVEFVHPFFLKRHHARTAPQQGAFTVCGRLLADHGQLIQDSYGHSSDRYCRKIIIDPQMKYDALRHLMTMNITACSLFPGLDGLGRSISEMIRLEFPSSGQF
jgi:hypothetical protein